MLNWIISDFLLSVIILATAALLFVWEKRRLKRASEEQWKTLVGARRIWTLTEGKKSVEAAWITAMRESIARDPWQPGLKPSVTEARIQKRASHFKIARQTESARCPTEDAESVVEGSPSVPSCLAPEPAQTSLPSVADQVIVWIRCKSGDPNIAKLRRWLNEGKTLFTVLVFPPADREWERIHEGLGQLEEVTELEAKFRFDGVRPWTLFPDFYVGYDRKRKRPRIQFRERL